MKKSRLSLTILMISLCLPLCALAEGLTPTEPLAGTLLYPEGASEAEARCALSYAYPQFEADDDASRAINAYYESVSRDMTEALFEPFAQEADEMRVEGAPPASIQIDYQVTRNDDRYLSVLLQTRQAMGNGESEALSADTFARDGVYAGQPLTLTQVLGLEQSGGDLSEQPTMAETLAYKLVWEIVQANTENVDGDYLDGLTPDAVQKAFSPETDFYMDENGNVVFFIQAGVLAGEVAGTLSFPFAPAEILSAVKE